MYAVKVLKYKCPHTDVVFAEHPPAVMLKKKGACAKAVF